MAAVGAVLIVNVVPLVMAVTTVLAAKVPVPETLLTNAPTTILAVLVTVIVVPELLAFVAVSAPTV